MREADRAAFAAAVAGELRFDEPMARRTTLRIGGPADAWLEPANADVAALEAMLAPPPEEWLDVYRVDTRVNKPENNDAALLERVADD